MSYILDALNKSEKERARNQLPGLRDLNQENTGSGLGARHFLIGLGALVLVNAGLVYYFFSERLVAPPEPAVEEKNPVSVPSVVVSPATAPAPAEATPVNEIRQPPGPAPSGPAVPMTMLPSSVQERLPTLEVTAHIYADDPEFRMVKIEGVSRKEGELIGNGLRLVRITETGLVLAFEEYLYRMDIVEDWQF